MHVWIYLIWFFLVIYVSNNKDLLKKNFDCPWKIIFLFLMGYFFLIPALWMSKCTEASNLRMLNKPWSVSINRYQVCQNTRRYNRGLSAGILKLGDRLKPSTLSFCTCQDWNRKAFSFSSTCFVFCSFWFLNNFGLVWRECGQLF